MTAPVAAQRRLAFLTEITGAAPEHLGGRAVR
jgi:hypothetical protein